MGSRFRGNDGKEETGMTAKKKMNDSKKKL